MLDCLLFYAKLATVSFSCKGSHLKLFQEKKRSFIWKKFYKEAWIQFFLQNYIRHAHQSWKLVGDGENIMPPPLH